MKIRMTPVLLAALFVSAGVVAQAATLPTPFAKSATSFELAKRGADDGAGDDRGGRGRGRGTDDGPNHT